MAPAEAFRWPLEMLQIQNLQVEALLRSQAPRSLGKVMAVRLF
jgi:hypothetical protein